MKIVKRIFKASPSIIMLFCIVYPISAYADTATAAQTLRIIIPKIALLDTNNTHTPLEIVFDPMTEAGANFPQATASSFYDVSSNIKKLKLYAKINKNLKNDYNLFLRVNAKGTTFKKLTLTNKSLTTLGRLIKSDKTLNYKASPAFSNKTIPYGNIDVVVTYTLVEP